MNNWKIADYRIFHYAGGASIVEGMITMQAKSGTNTLIANFTKLPSLPANTVNGTVHTAYFHYEQFLPMIDTLRNEGPAYVHIPSLNAIHVATTKEFVGEGE